MIHGVVSRNREATISLVIVNESRQTKLINAVIDTGYTGFLSLPSEIITELNLSWTGIDRGTLGERSLKCLKPSCSEVPNQYHY